MKYLGMNWKTFQVKTFISGGTNLECIGIARGLKFINPKRMM